MYFFLVMADTFLFLSMSHKVLVKKWIFMSYTMITLDTDSLPPILELVFICLFVCFVAWLDCLSSLFPCNM